MKDESKNLTDNSQKELKKIRRQIWWREFFKVLLKGFLKWIGAVMVTPVVVGFLTVLGKVCYYVTLWAWHLF